MTTKTRKPPCHVKAESMWRLFSAKKHFNTTTIYNYLQKTRLTDASVRTHSHMRGNKKKKEKKVSKYNYLQKNTTIYNYLQKNTTIYNYLQKNTTYGCHH